MAKQIVQGATMDLQRILQNVVTSTRTSETSSESLPDRAASRDTNQMTFKQKLIESFAKIISTAEPITGVKTKVTQKPTVFFLKQQSPTAHLSILRNPTRAYEKATPAFSPALGHASDAYIRFKQRQYQQDQVTVENSDYMATIKNPAHRMAQFRRYKNAKRSLNKIQRDHDAWIYNRKQAHDICEALHKDAMFWRSFHEDKNTVTNQDGEKERQWIPNDHDLLLGQAIERKMQVQGRSIEEWAGLKKAVQDVEQEQRHQRMVQHREQWRKLKYIPEEYNSDSEEEEPEEEEDEDYGHLYDNVDVPQVKISEVDAKDEAIATIPSSPSWIPQIKPENLEERSTSLQQRAHIFEPHPRKIVDTKTPHTNNTIHQESNEMASTTAKTTKEIVTETDAILSLAATLVSDLKDRYNIYYASSNVNMNGVLDAMRPKHLGYKCSWVVRPMAMTKKNLTPPPADQTPAIRLTNPSGVTCELIEGFQDLSTPWFEDYVAWRDEEQDHLIQAVREWREKEETFDEYDHRLVCEAFWDECLEKDLKCVIQERKNWENMDVIFEDDSDDDDDWDEYTSSRMSRSSSMITSVPDLEEDSAEPVGTNALEVARTNLASYTTILATAVVSAKSEAIALHRTNLEAPKLAQKAEKAKGIKDRYPHNLSYSITRLRLRLAEEGFISSDKNGFIYTPSSLNTKSTLTGPGSITFTGPIRDLLTTNKRVHDRAFRTLSNHVRVQAFRGMNFYKEVRISMAHVFNLNRDIKSSGMFKEQIRAAEKKMEGVRTVVEAVVHECVAEAERWERERVEKEKEKEKAVEVVKEKVIGDVAGDELGAGGKEAGKGKKNKAKGKGKGKKGKGKKGKGGKGMENGKSKGRRK